MGAPYTRNMPHAATYWPRGSNDGFGGVAYGEPVAITCRWQDVAELFRDPQGREVTSSAVVYVSEECPVGGKLFLGTSLELSPPATAREVRQAGVSPSLGGALDLHKVWL